MGRSGRRRLAWPKIEPIQQTDNYSCVVACLAMITAKPAAAVRRELGRSLCQNCGVNDSALHAYLASNGYASMAIEKKQPFAPAKAPWPPAPFADVHIATVQQETGAEYVWHAVIWLRDGRVFDPEAMAPMTLAHYARIRDVIGIYPVNGSGRRRRVRP